MRHLIIRLEGPLMAFGGETIDNLGVIRPFPALSMLTGMFANALGWRRVELDLHQRLQDRIICAARIDREPAGGLHITDYQTVRMADTVDTYDKGWVVGWTTRGQPERRGGALGAQGDGPFTHQRYRDYFADMSVTVALRLEPSEDAPTLDDLADALDEPKRPLFIGRKPCLPSDRLCGDFQEGDTALDALLKLPLSEPRLDEDSRVRLSWPTPESVDSLSASRSYMLTDERNWLSGLHGGARAVCDGSLPAGDFPKLDDEPGEE